MPRTYTLDEAREIAGKLEIDFESAGFDVEQFLAGLDVEAEHGGAAPDTDVTGDDPLTTGKIALAHLREMPDYYARLSEMEGEGAAPTRGSLMRNLVIAGAAIAAVMVVLAVVCTNVRKNRAAPEE